MARFDNRLGTLDFMYAIFGTTFMQRAAWPIMARFGTGVQIGLMAAGDADTRLIFVNQTVIISRADIVMLKPTRFDADMPNIVFQDNLHCNDRADRYRYGHSDYLFRFLHLIVVRGAP